MPASVGRTGPAANVHLCLSNRPENIMLVRQVLGGVAEAIDLDANGLYEISIAVTEACNNAVVHAYRGDEGPLEVEVCLRPAAMDVTVRDRGVGIPARTAAERTAGTGLSVIGALSRRVELAGGDGGTEVRMTFDTPQASALDFLPGGEPELRTVAEVQAGGAMRLVVAPPLLCRTILPRLLGAVAARAHFTTDRLAGTQLVADELASYAARSIRGSHLSIDISAEPRNLELRLGPLRSRRASEPFLACASYGSSPARGRLVTHHWVEGEESHCSGETLALRLIDRR